MGSGQLRRWGSWLEKFKLKLLMYDQLMVWSKKKEKTFVCVKHFKRAVLDLSIWHEPLTAVAE